MGWSGTEVSVQASFTKFAHSLEKVVSLHSFGNFFCLMPELQNELDTGNVFFPCLLVGEWERMFGYCKDVTGGQISISTLLVKPNIRSHQTH